MNATEATFTYAPVENMTCSTCDVCGAVVADWAKNSDGWTTERPNHEKHAAWHVALGA